MPLLFTLLCLLLLASPAPALAHEPGVTHGDNFTAEQSQQVGQAVAQASAAHPGVVGAMATRWCGSSTTSDLTTQPNPGANIKVIYAYAADQPNRFDNYADLIQRSAAQMDTLLRDASNGRLALRWDVGSECGTGYLDIQTVKLPRKLADYYYNYEQAFPDVRNAVGMSHATSWGNRNLLVFADQLGNSHMAPAGQGNTLRDSRPGEVNSHNLGGRVAMLYGTGGDNFFGDQGGDSYPTTVALHELGHTLGAVQNDAPHSTGAAHCNDGLDIMCYADRGPFSAYNPNVCAVKVFDCGADDYFSMSPAAGSYLATHWNLRDSEFVCAVEFCSAANTAPAVTIIDPAHGHPAAGSQATIRAQVEDENPGALRFMWDIDGQPGYEVSTGSEPSLTLTMPDRVVDVRLHVRDEAGMVARAATYLFPNSAPVALLSNAYGADITELTAYSDESVTLSGSGSWDAERGALGFAWTLNGTTVGNASVLTRSYPVGTHTLTLTVTDDVGVSATDSVRLTINARPDNGDGGGNNNNGGGDGGTTTNPNPTTPTGTGPNPNPNPAPTTNGGSTGSAGSTSPTTQSSVDVPAVALSLSGPRKVKRAMLRRGVRFTVAYNGRDTASLKLSAGALTVWKGTTRTNGTSATVTVKLSAATLAKLRRKQVRSLRLTVRAGGVTKPLTLKLG